MTHPLTDLSQRLPTDRVAIGLFLVTGDAMVAEACGFIDLDWVVIDMEAAPMTKVDALHQIQALASSACFQIIRVPTLDRHLIEHALDIGAHGVLVPKVETRAEAEALVDAAYFPPLGRRGVNPIRASGYFSNLERYFGDVNDRTTCAVQIETVGGLAAVDEIAAVPGIDIVFIGTGDLASSLGWPGRPDAPEVRAACARICAATVAQGKIPGIFAYSDELAAAAAAEGFRFIGLGNEIKLFLQAATDVVATFRRSEGQG